VPFFQCLILIYQCHFYQCLILIYQCLFYCNPVISANRNHREISWVVNYFISRAKLKRGSKPGWAPWILVYNEEVSPGPGDLANKIYSCRYYSKWALSCISACVGIRPLLNIWMSITWHIRVWQWYSLHAFSMWSVSLQNDICDLYQ
jgi:hypothetical protein